MLGGFDISGDCEIVLVDQDAGSDVRDCDRSSQLTSDRRSCSCGAATDKILVSERCDSPLYLCSYLELFVLQRQARENSAGS